VQPVRIVVPYGPADPAVRERVHAWERRLAPTQPIDIERGRAGHFFSGKSTGTTVVFRNATAWSQGLIEARLLQSPELGIYELDDGLFMDNGRIPGLGKWWKPFVAKSRIAHKAAKAADRVIAGNDLIAEWASQHCADVRVIPTCVDPSEYTLRQEFDSEIANTVVWIGGSATQIHLTGIADSLVKMNQETGARLVVIGDATCSLPDSLISFSRQIQWHPGVTKELALLGGIGIMPLPDRPYERYKCAYKLLQYAASGMVTIGSPVGASKEALNRFGGFTPTSSGEWTDALMDALRTNSATRQKIGAKSAAAINDHYSFDRWDAEYRRAIGAA
jgi:glycosyltransferase involved in cell wall biosynthesis